MTQPDWDDGRLEAAFRAKFDRPAPLTLEKDVHARIAGTSPARFGALQRGGPGWGLAAAAVVVVLVGAVTVGLSGSGRQGGSPPPSDLGAVATPGASATPTEQAVPGSMLGLEIMHVSDAIAIRDAGVDDRELAVMGWFTPAPPISCGGEAMKVFVSPVQLGCPDQLMWLTQDAESLFLVTGNGSNTVAPQGPALNPDLEGLDRSWFPDLPVIGQDGGSTPVDVVFVGHFDDRRAAVCPEAERAVCRDRFVVDSVALVAGQAPPRSLVRGEGLTPVSSMTDIESILNLEAPQSTILSIAVVDGPDGLVATEPSLRNGPDGLDQQPIMWVARVLESDRISTYVIVDGTDVIYEMTPEGEAILVGGTPPRASDGPWPPAGAVVIPLTSEVGAGAPPARVAVVDASGRLTSVSEKGTINAPRVPFEGRFWARAEAGTPGRVHLTWIGGICDSQITVTVAADVRTITFDMGPVVDCDSIGIGRELVLDFSGSVDVPAIELLDAAAAPTPAAGRGYELECGPLGPDSCEAKAADIVAANLRGSPPKRVVSIKFETECGSFIVLLDDGSVHGADIDCMLRPDPS